MLFLSPALISMSMSAQATSAARDNAGAATAYQANRGPDSATASNGRARLHRNFATAVPLANRFFDHGLSLHYGYRHNASVAAFREAQRLDPRCVMCALGEAIAIGPTVDAPMSSSAERQAVAAVRRAEALVRNGVGTISDAEWTRAVSARYLGAPSATRASRDTAYAKVMAALADANPADADAQALAAEATMILSPYGYWSPAGAPRAGTNVMVSRLRRAMRTAPGHIGACHFFVHVMEAVNPEARCSGQGRTHR